jgi:hypothetical protein
MKAAESRKKVIALDIEQGTRFIAFLSIES